MNVLNNIELPEFLSKLELAILLRLLVLLLMVWPLVFVLAGWARRFVVRHYSAQHSMIVGKIVQYGGSILVLILVFHELGFSLAPLLGAAGVLGVALGFASQTSVSNIISGLFLVAEQPFVVDDLIRVGNTTGHVLSIDILSVKLRTLDNQFVRIPNETIIKTEVVNVTRFPIRRCDIKVSVAYHEDLGRVRKILLDVAHQNPLALEEPEPLIILEAFGASGIDFNFAVWTSKADFLALKNSIQDDLKQRFDREGIEIPYPHLSIYTGAETKPFPVKLHQN